MISRKNFHPDSIVHDSHTSESSLHVAHVLNDLEMGGIKSVVESVAESTLAKHFRFSYHPLSPALWCRPLRAEIIMFHNACNWKSILRLLAVRIVNPKSKIVIQEHHYTAAFESNLDKPQRFLKMLKLNYAIVDRVVSVSKGQGAWIRKRNLLSEDKLSVIPQSCRIDHFFQLPFKQFQKPLVLAAYGRFCRQKGFDLLIKVAKTLPNVTFRFGGMGPEEDALKKLAEGARNIEFCGQIDDVPGFLESCHAVVIPSRFEPFGLVALEARAAGRPILVSNVDGLPEQAEGCGLIVNLTDEGALKNAINSLDANTLEKMAIKARESTRSVWETYVKRWHNLFMELRATDASS